MPVMSFQTERGMVRMTRSAPVPVARGCAGSLVGSGAEDGSFPGVVRGRLSIHRDALVSDFTQLTPTPRARQPLSTRILVTHCAAPLPFVRTDFIPIQVDP